MPNYFLTQGGGGQHEEGGELGVVEGEEEDGRGKTFTRPRFVKVVNTDFKLSDFSSYIFSVII